MSFRYFCAASCNNNPTSVWFSLICLESLGFLSTNELNLLKLTWMLIPPYCLHTLSIATSATDIVSATLEKSFLSKKLWNTKNFMNFSLFTCAPAVVLSHNTNVCLFWYIQHEHSNSSLFSFHHLKYYLAWCTDISIV